MGRAGRLHKPELTGSHGRLNKALHTLHKEAGLMPLSGMVRTLDGSGISRSTIYDAFSSTRLPAWHVVEALVEVLGTKHLRTTPEEILPGFYDLWQSAIDEEAEESPIQPPNASGPSPWFKPPREGFIHKETGEPAGVDSQSPWFKPPREGDPSRLPAPRGRVGLRVPHGEKDEAIALGARWDPERPSWYIDTPTYEVLSRWPAEEPPRS